MQSSVCNNNATFPLGKYKLYNIQRSVHTGRNNAYGCMHRQGTITMLKHNLHKNKRYSTTHTQVHTRKHLLCEAMHEKQVKLVRAS